MDFRFTDNIDVAEREGFFGNILETLYVDVERDGEVVAEIRVMLMSSREYGFVTNTQTTYEEKKPPEGAVSGGS
jgi:RNA binding exosome subunit